MSGFWNPARMEEDKQLQLDKRAILSIALEQFNKKLQAVQKKIDKDTENNINIDVFSITRKQKANINRKRDNLAFEKNEIERRIELIESELKNNA